MQNSHEVALSLIKFKPGLVPLEVFNQIARLTVVPVIELILVSNGQVLLLKRPDDDIYWAGQFCLPGKILTLSGSDSIDDYAQSFVTQLGSDIQGEVKFCGLKFCHTNRGDELAIVYILETTSLLNINNGYPTNLNNIPPMNIISEHKDIIESYGMSSSK